MGDFDDDADVGSARQHLVDEGPHQRSTLGHDEPAAGEVLT